MNRLPEAPCPICAVFVEDIDMHTYADALQVDGTTVYLGAGYSEIYVTLLPCQHKLLRRGLKIIDPDHGTPASKGRPTVSPNSGGSESGNSAGARRKVLKGMNVGQLIQKLWKRAATHADLSALEHGDRHTPTPPAEPQADVQPTHTQDPSPATPPPQYTLAAGDPLWHDISLALLVAKARKGYYPWHIGSGLVWVDHEGCNLYQDIHCGEYIETTYRRGQSPTCTHFDSKGMWAAEPARLDAYSNDHQQGRHKKPNGE